MDHSENFDYDVSAASHDFASDAEHLFDEAQDLSANVEEQPKLAEDNAASVTESDSSDLAFKKAEEKIDGLFELYGASAAALKPYLDIASPDIPLASGDFTHTLCKTASNSDGSHRIVDDRGEPLVFTIIGELTKGQHWDLNKVSPYLDMPFKVGQNDTISLNGFRRAKAQMVLRTLDIPELVSPEGQEIINRCNDRFEKLLAYLTTVHARYQETRAKQDNAAYGRQITGSTWVHHGLDFFGMNICTPPVFINVPSNKAKDPPVPIVQNRKLVSVEEANELIRKLKLQAVTRTDANCGDLSLIANWPDNSNLIRALGEEFYLGDVRVSEPDVFNAQGICIHPSMYKRYLRPGTWVAVKVAHKLWDYSYNRQEKPVPGPTRHCVAVALEMHVIGATEEDIRDSLHYQEARGCMERVKEQEVIQQAEEHRLQLKQKEADHLKIAADLAKAREVEKEERLKKRKSLWRAAASLLKEDSSPASSRGLQSTPSLPSSSKRQPEGDPPSSPLPTKRQMGSPIGKSSKASSGAVRTTCSKAHIAEQEDVCRGADKGKGKADEDMQVDE